MSSDQSSPDQKSLERPSIVPIQIPEATSALTIKPPPKPRHSYSIIEHKVEFPQFEGEKTYLPKYVDDSGLDLSEKKEGEEEFYSPVRKRSCQKSKTITPTKVKTTSPEEIAESPSFSNIDLKKNSNDKRENDSELLESQKKENFPKDEEDEDSEKNKEVEEKEENTLSNEENDNHSLKNETLLQKNELGNIDENPNENGIESPEQSNGKKRTHFAIEDKDEVSSNNKLDEQINDEANEKDEDKNEEEDEDEDESSQLYMNLALQNKKNASLPAESSGKKENKSILKNSDYKPSHFQKDKGEYIINSDFDSNDYKPIDKYEETENEEKTKKEEENDNLDKFETFDNENAQNIENMEENEDTHGYLNKSQSEENPQNHYNDYEAEEDEEYLPDDHENNGHDDYYDNDENYLEKHDSNDYDNDEYQNSKNDYNQKNYAQTHNYSNNEEKNELNEGAKEIKKKLIGSLTQNYLDKIYQKNKDNSHDNDLNQNNISYKIINEMLNPKSNVISEVKDINAIKKQIDQLNLRIDAKRENYNIINNDYQSHLNAVSINKANEENLKNQIDEYNHLLIDIDNKMKSLYGVNIQGKKTMMDELKLRREHLQKMEEEFKSLRDKLRLVQETKRKKESDLSRDFNPKQSDLQKNLESLRLSKLKLHDSLSQIQDSFSILLENKAMLKEDLNGKLLQRAELVAQREELDQIFEEFESKNQEEIGFFNFELEEKVQIANYSKKISDVQSNKKIYQNKIEIIQKKEDEFHLLLESLNKELGESNSEKKGTLEKIQGEKEKCEEILLENFGELEVKELEDFMRNLSDDFIDITEKIVMVNQLKFVEDEEEKMNLTFEMKMHYLGEKMRNAKSGQNVAEVEFLQEKNEIIKKQHAVKTEAITKWKKEVGKLLDGKRQTKEELKKLLNRDAIFKKVKDALDERGLEEDIQNNIQKIMKYYLDILNNYQTYYINKEIQEGEIRNQILTTEEEIEKIESERDEYLNLISVSEESYTKYVYSIKTLEQNYNEKKALFEHQLILQAENAYYDYLNQQAQTFEAINRTYGAKAAQHIKQEYYKQFLDIIKNNQQKKLEKYNNIKDDLKYLDEIINFNINNVENELLPQMKAIMMKISDSKQNLQFLKREQIKIMENEEELSRKETDLLNEKNKKLESLLQNVPNQNESENNELIKSKFEEIEKMKEDIKDLENIILEKDEDFTKLNQEKFKIQKELVKLEEKHAIQQKKRRKNEEKSEIYINTQTCLNELKLDIENLGNEKQILEKSFNENNLSNFKKDDLNKSSHYPSNINQYDDDEEFNEHEYLKEENKFKNSHMRAKSAPKNNVNLNLSGNNSKIFNARELVEEMNYINNFSKNNYEDAAQPFEQNNFESKIKKNINLPLQVQKRQKSMEDPKRFTQEHQEISEINQNQSDLNYFNNKNSSSILNNNYMDNVFDLRKLPIADPSKNNKKAGTLQQSQGNEHSRKNLSVNIQSLMQEANNTQNFNSTIPMSIQSKNNLISIRKCRYSTMSQDCNRHKKFFKFNFDNCTLKEIQFLESIKPLLEGSTILKKFTNFQSLKQPVFNPLTADMTPPENCGYGTRFLSLNRNLSKIEFKHHIKNSVENAVNVDQILRPLLPQITQEILKIQKKFDMSSVTTSFKGALYSDCNGNNSLNQLNKNLEKIINCNYYPFCLVLEKGGRAELIAPNYIIFREWVNGINDLVKMKKGLGKLRGKIEAFCMLGNECGI